MKLNQRTAALALTTFLAVIFSFSSCKESKETYDPPAFKDGHYQYISAFTSGRLDRNNDIQIRFTENVIGSEQVGHTVDGSPLSLTPGVKGTATWLDTRTLTFQPDGLLPSDKVFDGKLDLKALVDTVSSDLRYFEFQFYTPEQNFRVDLWHLRAMNNQSLKYQELEGVVLTDDFEDSTKIKKLLTVKHDGQTAQLQWTHYNNGKRHVFRLDSIQRQEGGSDLVLQWDGNTLGVDKEGELVKRVPGLDEFNYLAATPSNTGDQFIELNFSDPLKSNQALNGLIRLENGTGLTYKIEGSTVKAYPKSRLNGNVVLVIEPGVTNVLGYKLKEQVTEELNFESIKPDVKLVGNGTIVPTTEGIPFPFEAVNLNAVDVQITKIYENNVLQFFQNNDYSGSSRLSYVGKVIHEERVDLTGDPQMDLGSWNRHALDLSEIIEPEPGAIYRVQLRFRKDYALYPCDAEVEEDEDMVQMEDVLSGDEEKLWDYYNDYNNYNYQERENPCSDSYYYRNYGVKRNVLASDLGLIVKRGTDGKGDLMVAVTDIKTGQPKSNVDITFYDGQQQVMKTTRTDNKGFVRTSLDEQPFMVMASSGNQKGYMRLWSSSLSTSKFETGGVEPKKGVKGFIYQERGVYRPGDSIYVTFILEDKLDVLPDNHPVLFELFDPRGNKVEKRMAKDALNGFYTFYTATGLNAPTGNYRLQVHVGGLSFTDYIKVETIVPNRLKLKLDMKRDYFSADDTELGDLQVNWLHGAPAKEMRTELVADISSSSKGFDGYDGYTFTDPAKDDYQENRTLFEGYTNEEGFVKVKHNMELQANVSGKLDVTLNIRAYEPGGNFSIDKTTTTYHPYQRYVGLARPEGQGYYGILLTNEEQEFPIATVDREGKPVDVDNLEVEVYELSWRWWWSYSNDNAAYDAVQYEEPVASGTVATKNGKGSYKVNIPEGEWGRYLVRVCDDNGHCSGKIVYFDNASWYRRRPESGQGNTSIFLTSNQNNYEVGEEVSIDIPSHFSGRALVTIEKGGQVLKADWIQVKEGNTAYTFKATRDMAPNVYAYVIMMQPHAQTENDLPVRMYGILPVKVEDNRTHLQPEIAMPDVLRPESEFELEVSEANRQPMTYTVAVVDEGLLDLTRFETPDPWSHFYAKEQLNVTTWDMFDEVLGAYGLDRLLAVGGGGYYGDDDVDPEGSKVQRFKPMVRFLGPFHLKKGKTNKHTIDIPKYVGSVRTMVIAGDRGAYGSAEKTTPVKAPLMVVGTLPRVLGPGEEVSLPVSVFAMENHVKNVTVEVEADGLLQFTGPQSKEVSFSKPDEKLVSFPIKVADAVGVTKVQVNARSGKETASFEIELEVRAPNPFTSEIETAVLAANSNKSFNFQKFGYDGTNGVGLEVSLLPPINMEERLNYLIRYPYGCIEQTTSSVFPQLYLGELLDVSNYQVDQTEKNIKRGINRIKRFQLKNGGFSYWPGGSWYSGYDASEWGTNYAGHFLLEAKAKGYTVPGKMLEKWTNFQSIEAINWNDNGKRWGEMTQAYRLYLLALAGSPEFGAMNRMREMSGLDDMTLWLLAGAYHLAGQASVAEDMISGLSTEVDEYRELSYTYGSDVRDEAIILEILVAMDKYDEAFPLVEQLSKALSGKGWMSTQTTAYALKAVSKYAAGAAKEPPAFEYRLNNGGWTKPAGNAPISKNKLQFKPDGSGTVDVRNNGSKPLYANVVTQGIRKAGTEQAGSNGVRLYVNYTDMNGKAIDPTKLEQGTDLIAEITVTNPGDYGRLDEMALTHIFPSGWQIHNPRMTGIGTGKKTDKAEYMDVRDDRVYIFFDLDDPDQYSYYNDPEDSKTFRVALNASFTGRFYLPSVYTKAMYNEKIQAVKKGQWVEVVKPAGTP